MKAKDVMSRNVITVSCDTRVEEIGRLLSGHGIRGVPVVDAGKKVIGIVTEGDLLARVCRLDVVGPLDTLAAVLGLGSAREREQRAAKIAGVRAADVMTSKVLTVTPEAPLSDVAKLLIDKRINQLPVVGADGRLEGIVSRGDVIRALAG